MEGHCSTGQSPQWAVVPMEEEKEEEDDDDGRFYESVRECTAKESCHWLGKY